MTAKNVKHPALISQELIVFSFQDEKWKPKKWKLGVFPAFLEPGANTIELQIEF